MGAQVCIKNKKFNNNNKGKPLTKDKNIEDKNYLF
jgi:hypothetical protein